MQVCLTLGSEWLRGGCLQPLLGGAPGLTEEPVVPPFDADKPLTAMTNIRLQTGLRKGEGEAGT